MLDRLQHVDQGHQALDTAELVDHERGVFARFLEVLEQRHPGQRLRRQQGHQRSQCTQHHADDYPGQKQAVRLLHTFG